jgi:hypothetical protein
MGHIPDILGEYRSNPYYFLSLLLARPVAQKSAEQLKERRKAAAAKAEVCLFGAVFVGCN